MADFFPTTLVGSYTRPPWLANAISESRSKGSPVENLDELKTQAKLLTIKEIEDAGVDIVSDGEQGRTSFYEYMTEQMSGFVLGRPRVFASGISYTALKKPVGKVQLNAELSTVRDAEFLRLHTSRLTKVALISPYFLANFCWEPGGYYATRDSFLEDVLDASKTEARAMSGKTDYIQWDDPGIPRFAEEKMSEPEGRELTKRAVETLNTVIKSTSFPPRTVKALHVCWGNYKATHLFDGSLSRIYPELLQSDVDAFFIEMASALHEDDVQVFKEFPSSKKIGAGVIDVKTPDVEPVRIVKKRAERLLKNVEPQKLILSTDCGFAPTWDSDRIPRSSCYLKLKSMALAAQELRSTYK